jgi:hypothetical protein
MDRNANYSGVSVVTAKIIGCDGKRTNEDSVLLTPLGK